MLLVLPLPVKLLIDAIIVHSFQNDRFGQKILVLCLLYRYIVRFLKISAAAARNISFAAGKQSAFFAEIFQKNDIFLYYFLSSCCIIT